MKFISQILLGLFASSLVFLCLNCSRKQVQVNAVSEPMLSKLPKPRLNVYIENSGSMDGYMCPGSGLKDAIYDYVSDLNCNVDTTCLYFINSQKIPFRGELTDYITSMTPAKFRDAGGNRANTDLRSIISEVLKTVNEGTVSLFVSDCILDLPSKDASSYLQNCQIRIKNELNSAIERVPNLGVEVLKLSSSFDGKYFYPTGGFEALKGVKRPYYVWMFGDKRQLAKLNKVAPLSRLQKYNLQGSVAFANLTVLPYEVTNRNMTGGIVLPLNGAYEVTLRVNFDETLQSDEVVRNLSNYRFLGKGAILNGVYPITDKDSKHTHYINITIPQTMTGGEETLLLEAPSLPAWIAASNDESGLNIRDNLDKTTGIKYLIEGVADAYRGECVRAKMKFNVKRK